MEEYIQQLERQWEKQPYPTFSELLVIFPESKQYLSYRLKALQETTKRLKKNIRKRLRRVYKRYSGFELWFFEYLIEVCSGDTLDRLSQEATKLKFFLLPNYKKIEVENGVSDSEILKAKMFPLPALLGLPVKPKQITKCIFHSDKTASLWITENPNGTWYAWCFSCQKGWDNIGLLMERDNLKFIDAVKRLN